MSKVGEPCLACAGIKRGDHTCESCQLTFYMVSGQILSAVGNDVRRLADVLHRDSVAPISFVGENDRLVTINRKYIEATVFTEATGQLPAPDE